MNYTQRLYFQIRYHKYRHSRRSVCRAPPFRPSIYRSLQKKYCCTYGKQFLIRFHSICPNRTKAHSCSRKYFYYRCIYLSIPLTAIVSSKECTNEFSIFIFCEFTISIPSVLYLHCPKTLISSILTSKQ